MSDLIEDAPGPGGNMPEYGVSEISGAVKRTIEGAFGRVRVRGELGRVVRARSGHLYFDLKDDRAVLGAVTWKGQVPRLGLAPEEGLEVIATGRLTTFPSQSKYQLTVETLEPAGTGALMALLEKRRAQLAAEGLFDAARKRPLPYLPRVIGVVTSPTGAVIRDILHRLGDRFPRHVLVWPVAVQGRDCAAQVAAAIAGFNRLAPDGPVPRPDVLIVARGGGSVEDLWGFNEEIVVRAVAASAIPVISAVGHETDTTLIDHAADQRAPTPTAAAEFAVPVRLELLAAVRGLSARLIGGLARGTALRRERLRALARALPQPATLVAGPRQRLDHLSLRLPAALGAGVQRRRVGLVRATALLRPGALRDRLGRDRRAAGQLGARLAPVLVRAVGLHRRALGQAAGRLRPDLILRDTARQRRDLARLGLRLGQAMGARLTQERLRLAAQGRMLGTLGYRETLARGYAVVWADGAVATTTAEARGARLLEIELADGRLPLERGPKPPKKPRPGPRQGSLF